MFLTLTPSASRAPDDDFWYAPVGARSAAGVHVSTDSAMRLAVVYACVKVLAETVGATPLHCYKRLPGQDGRPGGKQRVTDHPVARLIEREPNPWQTPMEFRELLQGHLGMRGNAYAEIVFDAAGRPDMLIPLHPDHVLVERLQGGSWRYRHRANGGAERVLVRGEVLHLRGLSSDGVVGLNPIEIEREAIGLGLAAQDYGARFFSNNASLGGWIESPNRFKDQEQADEFRRRWQSAYTGANRFRTPVLENGMKYHQIGVNNADAQFLETRRHQDVEIARMFRMPPHKVGILDKATFSNIEQQAIEFLTDTMLPWFVRWEQRLSADLLDDDGLFFEFLVDGMLRGDQKSRYDAYGSAILDGWMTRNEARARENLNPLPGLDEPLEPLNMRRAGDEPPPPPQRGRGKQDAAGDGAAQGAFDADRLHAYGRERVARKEAAALARESGATIDLSRGERRDALHRWAGEFFGETHAAWVARATGATVDAARQHVTRSRLAAIAAIESEASTGEHAVQSLIRSWNEHAADLVARFEE